MSVTTVSGKLRILISDLNLRKTPSLSGETLGYASKGVHDYTEKVNADGYD